MKGDQMGALAARPSLKELSLSNWTRFRKCEAYDRVYDQHLGSR